MLIDKSYFVGPLTIAQLGQKAVVDDLNNFIAEWEPKVMAAALGYDFYQTFLNGLTATVVDQRWLDMLQGVVFANLAGIKRKWVGFSGGDNTNTLIVSQRDNLTIYGGITAGFAVGDYQYTDSSLDGWNFYLELFGAGSLAQTDWNYKTGGGFVLTDTTHQTKYNERWIIHFTSKKIATIATGGKNFVSPLAGFIYYEYMVNLETQNTGIGVVKSEGENSLRVSSAKKLSDAYNQAVKDMMIFWEFIQVKTLGTSPSVYPEFSLIQVNSYNYFTWYDNGMYSFTYVNPLF